MRKEVMSACDQLQDHAEPELTLTRCLYVKVTALFLELALSIVQLKGN